MRLLMSLSRAWLVLLLLLFNFQGPLTRHAAVEAAVTEKQKTIDRVKTLLTDFLTDEQASK